MVRMPHLPKHRLPNVSRVPQPSGPSLASAVKSSASGTEQRGNFSRPLQPRMRVPSSSSYSHIVPDCVPIISPKYQPPIPVSVDTHHKLRKLQSRLPRTAKLTYRRLHRLPHSPTTNPSHPPPTLRTLPTQPPTFIPIYTSSKGPIEPRRFLTNASNIHLAADYKRKGSKPQR
jgi:hypothetical protein